MSTHLAPRPDPTSDRPRAAVIDPASKVALDRSGQDDKPVILPVPSGQDTQPGSVAAVSTYQRPTPHQARLHELRAKATGKLAYVEFTIPEFAPLTPNIRHAYESHTNWETPGHYRLADHYPTGQLATFILWDRDRPDGQVVTATSAERDIHAAYVDCERQLRLKRHSVAYLLRHLEYLALHQALQRELAATIHNQLTQSEAERERLTRELDTLKDEVTRLQAINTCSHCGDVVEGETVVCETCYHAVSAPPPAAGSETPHPLDATTLVILRSGWPKLTREGGYFAMLDGTLTTTTRRFGFAVALLDDLTNPRLDQRGSAWQALVRAHTGRLEA